MGDGKKSLAASDAAPNSDEEMFKNLDVLLNLEELEESDFWDEMMNLSELEAEQTEGARQGAPRGNN